MLLIIISHKSILKILLKQRIDEVGLSLSSLCCPFFVHFVHPVRFAHNPKNISIFNKIIALLKTVC